jgi:glyoxylase-like metal-dependent hydrolase (beta-lactamase superfamily II)
MKIIPLSEGTFTIDATRKPIPFNPEKDSLQSRGAGSLLIAIQPFLVIGSKDILLLDTGLDIVENGMLKICEILSQHGISASDITKVLISHLHSDHAGGVGFTDEHGTRHLTFPYAKYYVQEQELTSVLETESLSYLKPFAIMLKDNPQVELLNGSGKIDDYITYELTGAHSPHHQVFWIREDGETVFYGADDAPQLGQMRKRYIAKYDFDGEKCMNLRRQWLQQGEQEKWTFLFYHDRQRPMFRFE